MNKVSVLLIATVFTTVLWQSEGTGASAPGSTQTNAGGGVTAKVTYLNPKSADDPRFQVVLDTHSVNLDSYDLKTVAVLRDSAGNVFLPKAIENMGSGHHRQSTLVFPKIANGAKRLELVIKDVAGVKERVFRWDLQ